MRGDAVDEMVLSIDIDNKRISLGLKQAEEDPWLQIGEAYPVGTTMQGRVVHLMDKGVVVDLAKENVQNPADVVNEGQLVKCHVLEVDPIHHRIVVAVTGYPEEPVGVAAPAAPEPAAVVIGNETGRRIDGRISTVSQRTPD